MPDRPEPSDCPGLAQPAPAVPLCPAGALPVHQFCPRCRSVEAVRCNRTQVRCGRCGTLLGLIPQRSSA